MQHEPIKPEVRLSDILPGLTDKEIREAEEVLDDYLAFVIRLYDRISGDPDSYAAFKALTEPRDELYDETTKVDLPTK